MEAAAGLDYLHSKGCIHRDIAARNLLIEKVTKVRRGKRLGECGLFSISAPIVSNKAHIRKGFDDCGEKCRWCDTKGSSVMTIQHAPLSFRNNAMVR